MANPTPPGGSYLAGAQTPEGQLCHRSALLIRLKVHHWHVEQSGNGDYIPTCTCLVVPSVEINRAGAFLQFAPVAASDVDIFSITSAVYSSTAAARADPDLMGHLVKSLMAALTATTHQDTGELVVSALGFTARFAREANLSEVVVSASSDADGEQLTIMRVFAEPPSESCKSSVSL